MRVQLSAYGVRVYFYFTCFVCLGYYNTQVLFKGSVEWRFSVTPRCVIDQTENQVFFEFLSFIAMFSQRNPRARLGSHSILKQKLMK